LAFLDQKNSWARVLLILVIFPCGPRKTGQAEFSTRLRLRLCLASLSVFCRKRGSLPTEALAKVGCRLPLGQFP